MSYITFPEPLHKVCKTCGTCPTCGQQTRTVAPQRSVTPMTPTPLHDPLFTDSARLGGSWWSFNPDVVEVWQLP